MSDLIPSHVTRGDFTCPWCDERNDSAIYLGDEGRSPKLGDIGLCAACARPMVHQEHGKPRRPTETEWKELNANRAITDARKAIFMSNHGNVSYRDLDVTVTDDRDE
jgi:hypothetical protein